MASWPDVEGALVELLAPLVPENHTGTATTADLESALPFLRVGRVGGPRDDHTDYGSYDIDAFVADDGAGRDAAITLLNSALELIGARQLAGNVVLDTARVTVGPVERPWLNKFVRRWASTVQVTARRQ